MLYRIDSVEARPVYQIRIRFADGVEGEVDLSELVGHGVFELWKDPAESRLHPRPHEPDSGALPDCATSRKEESGRRDLNPDRDRASPGNRQR
jgi:hypothetical protein